MLQMSETSRKTVCSMRRFRFITTLLMLSILGQTKHSVGFQLSKKQCKTIFAATESSMNDETGCDNCDKLVRSSDSEFSRRDICRSIVGATVVTTSGLLGVADPALAVKEDENGYVAAVRPTAYRVDSTIPPTLLPLTSARKEKRTLNALGRGSGTDKEEIKIDTLNLNNFMNKAVFGSIDAVSQLLSETKDESKSGPGYASFVCMGLPFATKKKDIDLASSLLNSILQDRDAKLGTALGLSFCPMSLQPALNTFTKSGNESALLRAMKEAGVPVDTIDLYMPVIRFAKGKSLDLLALSPEFVDIKAARASGLAAVDFERRQSYVLDPEGFIAVTRDPRYKLYTDRSLLKDYKPIDEEDDIKGFFAERIFVHETAASVVAKYAVEKPESLVTVLAPTRDVRYLQGINGRIPRVYGSLIGKINENSVGSASITNKVSDNAVTTILLNPTAEESLSAGRFLRLEIGTGPDTLPYQTKVADYLWFSASPKVNLIPRMMNG